MAKAKTDTAETQTATDAAPEVETSVGPKTLTTDEGTFTTDAQGVVVHTRS